MTPQMKEDNVIRISHDEAFSDHVDDLLKRQASLRGERGITRNTRRKWYYQNWFIFMLAGILGSFVAWAIIEPFFDDMLYIQGEVTTVVADEPMPQVFNMGDQSLTLRWGGKGWIELRGQRVWFLNDALEITAEGSYVPLDLTRVDRGQTVGVYFEYLGDGFEEVYIARFLETSPTPNSRAATMDVSQLSAQGAAAALLLFPLVAGLIGLAIGAADGVVCRLWRRALLGGGLGFLIGFIGGFVAYILANLIYMPLSELASAQMDEHGKFTAFGFVVQMIGRGLAWMLAGTAMGLGQGIALRSKRVLLYGLLGGVVGGLVGGLLFDPIDLLLLGQDKPSAMWARLIGLAAIGATVGAMIGVVELLARDAWLRMVEGPLAGKEFMLFKDVMSVGSGPRSDVYLFNDPQVAPQHAVLRCVADDTEIETRNATANRVMVNQHPVSRARLRHGDTITIGKTVFVFQKRQG